MYNKTSVKKPFNYTQETYPISNHYLDIIINKSESYLKSLISKTEYNKFIKNISHIYFIKGFNISQHSSAEYSLLFSNEFTFI